MSIGPVREDPRYPQLPILPRRAPNTLLFGKLVAASVGSCGRGRCWYNRTTRGYVPGVSAGRTQIAEAIRDDALEAERLAEQTHTVRAAAIDLHAAEVELAATRRFTPELSAGADVELPGPTYSLSLGFTVRPSDWDGSAKAQAAEDVRFAEIDLETARTATEYAARSALLELDLALEDLDAAAHDRALAEQALAEARFRFGRGGVTRLAVARTELALEKAVAARDAARATVVARWYKIDLVQF